MVVREKNVKLFDLANQLTILIHYCTINSVMNMNDLTRIQIKKLQSNMPLIRKIMGWSAVELADKIGVTKQTTATIGFNHGG